MTLLNENTAAVTLQRVMSTFKHFERKLDILQNSVSYHGQTLNDLRFLMKNISGGLVTGGSTVYPDNPSMNRPVRMSAAIQYEPQIQHIGKKRKRPAQLPPKNTPVRAKTFQSVGAKLFSMPFEIPLNDSPIKITTKNRFKKAMRQDKAEAPYREPLGQERMKWLENGTTSQKSLSANESWFVGTRPDSLAS